MTSALSARLALLLLASVATGCSHLAYYAQATSGHLEVIRLGRPLQEVINSPLSDPELKQQLRVVQAVRDFASRELGLPDNNSYRVYADLGRPYVVWNVFAAAEFSVEPLRWCLLVVGCVAYRGYYQRQDAEHLASELRQEGNDTVVAGVAAYSTLGYFDDPVLNTFLRLGTLEVARIIFHELAHQVVFVAGDTAFNEAFATAVENEGMRRWLRAHATPDQIAAFAAQQQRRAAVSALMTDYRARFTTLYRTQRPVDQLREEKAALFSALRADYAQLRAAWGGYSGFDALFGADLNNARLASLSLYDELLPAFERLLADLRHNLLRFYQHVAALAALDRAARRVALEQIVSLQPSSAGGVR